MTWSWLKAYLPRSLYGRAALILLLPVIVTQLVVSVVFIQRHYDGITRQMTHNLTPALISALQIIDRAPSLDQGIREAAPILIALGVGIAPVDPAAFTDRRSRLDLSARTLIPTLRADLPQTLSIDLLSQPRQVLLVVSTRFGPIELRLPRKLVGPSNPHQLLVISGLAAALMSLIAIIYLRNQLRPIKRLAIAAEAFGKGQTVAYRPSGAMEVRAAGSAFLDMRKRIERQIEQRTMMLSGVSHDLRTPLTRMKLALSMIEGAEAQELRRDVDDMARLIDEFLAFAREDAVEATEVFAPEALLDAVMARRSGLPVTRVPTEGSLAAMPLRVVTLTRAIDNLIDNALRYGTLAQVSVRREGASMVFAVEDNGPGIPEDLRERAVQPFQRLDSARNQDKGSGVGLGLAIAADAARRHGGRLRLATSATLGGLLAELVVPLTLRDGEGGQA